MLNSILPIATALLLTACATTSTPHHHGPKPSQPPWYDSGGVLLPEQAAYDVLFCDLELEVRPEEKAIEGRVHTRARIVSPIDWFVLDLDPRLAVESTGLVTEQGEVLPREVQRRGGRLWIPIGRTAQPGEELVVEVRYGGEPRPAPNAPWRGGFTWAETADGSPWIATSCQGEGADIWWPVKDHVSDEPDGMAIRVTVPDPLVVASNGRLERVIPTGDGRSTYHWLVTTPINTYCVALNIAPYETVEGTHQSVAGDEFPVVFYVLPEHLERGREFFPEIIEHLRFYEETVGPYPFRADKYGVAQTPHLGMEHQTIIAYGAEFKRGAMTGGKDWGFDVLHHHELSHEWWGNLVTNRDWADMWIHEGFGTYMQALHLEWKEGIDRYHDYIRHHRRRMRNAVPLASRTPRSSTEAFGADIYFKGAWVLHTLRYLIGDEAMRTAIRRMAYPDPELEKVTDGRQCRFATTDEFVELCAKITGRDLAWFFEVYARQAKLPRLQVERDGGELKLEWDVPDGLAFPMPIDVRIGEEVRRVEMPGGRATLAIPADAEIDIDPEQWILMGPLPKQE